MTIAGIKARYDIRGLIEHPIGYTPFGTGLYTTEQVREILIEFANSVSVIVDWDYSREFDSVAFMGYNVGIDGVVVEGDDSIAKAVDVFMKGE